MLMRTRLLPTATDATARQRSRGYVGTLAFGDKQQVVTLTTSRASGTFAISVVSATGYATALWWDGTTTTHGTGVPSSGITVSKAIPTAGVRTMRVFASTAGGVPEKALTEFAATTQSITVADFADCSSLTRITLSTMLTLVSTNFSGCTGLTNLTITGGSIPTIDLTGCRISSQVSISGSGIKNILLGEQPLLVLTISSTGVESLDVTGCRSMVSTYIQTNNSLSSLYCNNLPAVLAMYNTGNPVLAKVDISNNTAQEVLDLGFCSMLTSVRAQNVTLDGGKTTKYGPTASCNLFSTGMPAAALNQLYTDLGTVTSGLGIINVSGTPGASSDNPAIATAKNYVVIGT